MFADFERQLAQHAVFIPGTTIAWTAIGPHCFAIGSVTKALTGMLLDVITQRRLPRIP